MLRQHQGPGLLRQVLQPPGPGSCSSVLLAYSGADLAVRVPVRDGRGGSATLVTLSGPGPGTGRQWLWYLGDTLGRSEGPPRGSVALLRFVRAPTRAKEVRSVVLVELGLVEQRHRAVLELLDGAKITDVAVLYGVRHLRPAGAWW